MHVVRLKQMSMPMQPATRLAIPISVISKHSDKSMLAKLGHPLASQPSPLFVI